MGFCEHGAEPALVVVACRRARLFHHPCYPRVLIIFISPPHPLSSLLLPLLSFYHAYAAWFLPWVAAPTQVGVIVV